MDCAELEFEYHTADQLLSHCRWTQNTLPSAQDLNLCRFLRLLSTLKLLLTKIGTSVLAPKNQRVRSRSGVQPAERCGAMQATKKQQSVLQDDRFTQGCPTLTLKQGCICQYWFIRLPSRLEGTA
ncbi:hypothetical protein H6F86_11370 [Phormidium sp. FACHB-592]|uniref:Uncharacterized protein n=1 Tax=Stenomitos frigidus AS-A4 TaxID=2933935 RepID=A0ABV0KLU6_9CYAN|nr:hypothetical protein [Phormidium sp. FACHB-592]MBD2074473.1 hypothetical protein [Phormidium sp. FACHB-592]